MRIRFLAFALSGLIGMPCFSLPPALAADDVVVLNLQDSVGQTRQMICRPAQPGETAPIKSADPAPAGNRATPSPTSVAAEAGAGSKTGGRPVSRPVAKGVTVTPLPGSPSIHPEPAPRAPVNPAGSAPVEFREAQAASYFRNCPPPPPPSQDRSWQLYANPAAVAAAWECYAPRQMASSPRPWRGPDPAVHSPLPPLQKASAARPARRSAPAKAAAPATPCPSVTTPPTAAVATEPSPVMPAPNITPTNGAVSQTGGMTPAAGAMPAAMQTATQNASATNQTRGASGMSGVYSGPAPSVP